MLWGSPKHVLYRQMQAVYMPVRLIYAECMPFIQRLAVLGVFAGLMLDVTVTHSAQSLCSKSLLALPGLLNLLNSICSILAKLLQSCVFVQVQHSAVDLHRMTVQHVYLFWAVYSAMKH